jgi:uncharacterized protein YigE (DUF2233 family)
MSRRWLGLVGLILAAQLLGCQLLSMAGDSLIQPTASLMPTPTLAVSEAVVPPAPDSGWVTLQPGLERRLIYLEQAPARETLYLLRLDPATFRFDVAYQPGQPLSLAQWQAQTGALLVVNGGFFTEANLATGLTIVDGQPSGTSYTSFGGMLAIGQAGPELRWLPQQPYDPAESLLAGLQSFPMLIRPGGLPGYPEEDNLPARRTVIGQDRAGRILFLIANSGTLSLNQLGRYLADSDLDLDRALNLDGGASSGLLLADPADGVMAFSLLPAVITVYPRP